MRRALLLLAAAASVTACSGGGSPSEGDRANPKAGEVFLEPFGAVGPYAFTKSVALAPVPPPPPDAPSGTSRGLRSVRGDAARLYGAAGSQQPCDATAAVRLLLDDESKAQAWADTLNDDDDLEWSGGSKLAVEDIPTYVGELTSLFLRSDTRVTNHGVENERAFAFQSVLQRGTAVMVDARGVPRARCASFSPLTAPEPAASPEYRGEEWERFDKTKLVAVTPGAAVTTFRAVDLRSQATVDVPAGQTCVCDRTSQSSTTTSLPVDEETTTTTTGRPTTTRRPTTTAVRPATTTTTPPTTTSNPPTTANVTTTTAPI